jgi:hypothetical protein
MPTQRRTTPLSISGLLFGAALGFSTAVACDGEEECTRGTEACLCTDNGGCLPHLECISDYCVDPNWTPSADDDGADDDGVADGKADGDDDGQAESDDGSTAPDNVGACQAWVDAYDCGGFDIGQSLNCDQYAQVQCDISEYFECLTDNTTCTMGFPNTSGWTACVDLAMCE